MKRRWITETTGEERPVKPGEYYLSPQGLDVWPCSSDSFMPYLILSCLEICLDHSLALPCRYCEEIAEDIAKEYRLAMAAHRNMGD